MKKWTALVLSILIFANTITVSAAEVPSSKEEVVYGIADASGTITNVYVVNSFGKGNITDYPVESEKDFYPELLLYKENTSDEETDESEVRISERASKAAKSLSA